MLHPGAIPLGHQSSRQCLICPFGFDRSLAEASGAQEKTCLKILTFHPQVSVLFTRMHRRKQDLARHPMLRGQALGVGTPNEHQRLLHMTQELAILAHPGQISGRLIVFVTKIPRLHLPPETRHQVSPLKIPPSRTCHRRLMLCGGREALDPVPHWRRERAKGLLRITVFQVARFPIPPVTPLPMDLQIIQSPLL